MSAPLASAAALAVALLSITACGSAQGEEPSPHQEVTQADAAVALVGRADADLLLIVSNQSLDVERVRLRVMVDDVTVVDDEFHVEDQHNWVQFPLSLPSGRHEITAESDSGATLSETFDVPGHEPRYGVLEHWTEDDSAETDDEPVDLTWQYLREAPAFG